MLLLEVLVVLARRDVEPRVGADPAALDRVVLGMDSATSSQSTRRSGKSNPAVQRTVSSAASRARSSGSTSVRSSRRDGAR